MSYRLGKLVRIDGKSREGADLRFRNRIPHLAGLGVEQFTVGDQRWFRSVISSNVAARDRSEVKGVVVESTSLGETAKNKELTGQC